LGINSGDGTLNPVLRSIPPSVELLAPTTPSFQTWTHDPQFSKHIDASGYNRGKCPKAFRYTIVTLLSLWANCK